MEIWAAPTTTYVTPEKQLDSFTLDDDIDFTGKVIASFSYKGIEQPVASWVDMYQNVLKILHSNDKSILSGLAYANDDSVELSLHISNTESAFSKCAEIDSNIYVWTNTGTQYKINTLRKFFLLFGANPEDLVLFMKDAQEEEDEIVGTRFETRKKYWSFALPDIQAAHADTGCFSGCTGSKDNWISGFYGVNGCCVACVANYDCARVEIHIGTNDISFNKSAFDSLCSNKVQIEDAIGTSVFWDRGEDKKSSRIYVELNGVSINNEVDWLRMKTFHAEMSKKLYNVIVPFILNAQ